MRLIVVDAHAFFAADLNEQKGRLRINTIADYDDVKCLLMGMGPLSFAIEKGSKTYLAFSNSMNDYVAT